MQTDFALNTALDATALAEQFAELGRVHIPDILAPAVAQALHAELRGRSDWRQVLNSGDKIVELTRETRAALSSKQGEALSDAVYSGARSGFQYRYETLRVPDGEAERRASSDLLARFASWWSSDAVLPFLRHVTGSTAIDFADAQGTAYAPGDFLTGHDDAFEGKNRVAAYVLNLSPVWRPEWGGVLLFHGRDNDVAGWSPSFNTLNLFRVGQMHSVSEVTRAAAFRRYAVTGWLRRRA